MIRKTYLTCSAGLLLAVAACSSSTDLATSISQSAATKLAADMDAVSSLGAADFGLGATVAIRAAGSGATAAVTAPIAINNTFSVTKQCPLGGTVVIAGTIVGTGDQTTRSLTVAANATRADAGCAFQTDDGVLTLNGNIAYTGNLNIVSGMLSGPQTQTLKGTFTWARPGGSGTCDVDLSSSYDPATHIATVTGTFCGKAINVTKSR
jgi:autotransporter-associated beta strand protein